MGTKSVPLLGLEERNRRRLHELHRAFSGPFDVGEASEALGLRPIRTRRLLAYLAARGWLARVRRGLYTTVPLEATDPASWLADPWLVASRTFDPCYIGGWTALSHWELTDQIFRPVVVFTATAVKSKERRIQGAVFRLRQVSDLRFFGVESLWRQNSQVKISSPERTLIDCLDRPDIGGGIRHLADCLQEWLDGDTGAREELIRYGDQLGNQTVFKRLGYILEESGFHEPGLVEACRKRISAGLSPLDPSSSVRGRIVKRWNLRVNARL